MDKKNINILINVGFLLAIIFVCVILTTAIIMFYKNMEIIRNDPITYVMKQMNFTSCNCELGSQEAAVCFCNDIDNRVWNSYGKNFINQESVGNFKESIKIDLNDLNISFSE